MQRQAHLIEECHANCRECTGPANTECEYECNAVNSSDPESADFCNDCMGTGLYVTNHSCQDTCPDGMFGDLPQNLCIGETV